MRPTIDKDFFDIDALFDQYVDTDLLQQFSDNTAEPSSPNDLAHLFELPSSNESDLLEVSLPPNHDAGVEDAWRKAPQNIKQNPASPAIPSSFSPVYPEFRGKASLSCPEIFNIDDLFEPDKADARLTLSTPSTPKHISRLARKAVSNLDRNIRKGIQNSSRRSIISSKTMRASHRPGFQELWTRKMNSSTDPFHVQLPPSVLPSSPPPSSKFLQEENSGGFFARNQPYTIAMSPLEDEDASADIHHSNYQLTPLSSPTIDINSHAGTGNLFQFSNDKMATAYVSHHMSNAALSALQTPPDSHHLSMETWDPETPASLDFSFSASPEFQSPNPGKMQGWWGNTNTPATAPQPAVLAYQASASRSQSQAMGFSTASVAGLGITCDTASFPGLGAELERPSGNTQTTGFTPSASSFDMNCTSMYNNPIPISQSSPSRSPSLSPFLQPRFSRRRQSSNPSHTTRTHRRKSSTSSSHCTIRSSTVGFVNFTPDDSRKILTGVAPSGSSKTKARREKEAAEKRRKLSRAAVKAVMDVGGDIGGLEKEGLLCVE